jgi:hypothetical protein
MDRELAMVNRRAVSGLVRRVVIGGIMSLIAAGCSDRDRSQASAVIASPVAQQSTAMVNSTPPALLDVGEKAAELFDAARLSNWTDAAAALEAMNESATDLPVAFSRPDLAERLQSRLEDVGDAVSARQRLETMDSANGITRLVAELSADDETEIPAALVMLGYYGRELEFGIAKGDQARLKRTAADLQQAWNRFERTILQRGATDEARRFTDIVVQLDGARTPGDFVAPTRAELDAVDRLEKIYRR